MIPGQIQAPLPLRRHRHKRESNTIWFCGLGVVAAYLLPEIGSIVSICFKASRTHTVDPFVCPWYHYKIPVYWLVKFIGEYAKELILTLVVVKLAAKYSPKLFTVSLMCLIYSVVDFGMFFWNFATYVFSYWCAIWFVIIVSIGVLREVSPYSIARIRSIF